MSVGDVRRKVSRFEWLGIGYSALMLLTLGVIDWRAEIWLPLALLSFAPPVIFAFPFALIIPVVAYRRRWLQLAGHIVAALLLGFVFAKFHAHRVAGDGAGCITMITHNIGQGDREAFADYFPTEEPDIVLLQDAARRRDLIAKRFPRHRVKALDQFLILTPHTILRSDIVTEVKWRSQPVVARFELMVNGRETAVYSVHMPTPRPSLKRILSPRVWLEMVGIADAPTEGFPSYRAWLDARMALAKGIIAILEKERLPLLVGGDFNMPDHGGMYRLFASKFVDAFAASGNGWGFTFPGAKESRIGALLGPWLRLDYLFAGHGWKPVECRTADDALSQHRAVLARFEPDLRP